MAVRDGIRVQYSYIDAYMPRRGPRDSLVIKPEIKLRPSMAAVELRYFAFRIPGIQRKARSPQNSPLQVCATCISNSYSWWEEGSEKPNVKEIHSAQEFMDSITNAGGRLVVVEFYSPACGACRALRPKIQEFAAMNSNTEFLKVKIDDNRQMCCSLRVPVLPFFQFYRGSTEGCLYSFSCTTATVKKFKDALEKYKTDKGNHEEPLLEEANKLLIPDKELVSNKADFVGLYR